MNTGDANILPHLCGKVGDGGAGISADAYFFKILVSDASFYELIHRNSLLRQN